MSPKKKRKPAAAKVRAAKAPVRIRSMAAAPGGPPGPIAAVPKSDVGRTVQDFIDLDDVHDLEVTQDASGTFIVRPTR